MLEARTLFAASLAQLSNVDVMKGKNVPLRAQQQQIDIRLTSCPSSVLSTTLAHLVDEGSLCPNRDYAQMVIEDARLWMPEARSSNFALRSP